ncbi:MAG: serine/threonine protein kinase [Anaerolineae bacterium]|nr:serine/threonine protein kinase [Anaerolineae bacterium]
MERSIPDTPMLSNRYKLLDTLGAGGMAVVYRAQDMMLERPVAIKLLRQDFSGNQSFRHQFRLEAKAAANLSHPNIVTVYDFGFDAGRLFIVMEYVPGKDLKSSIRERGRFPVTEAVNLIAQAAAGIGYAHRAGLVHCDVKPHNIIVTPDGRLKVTDFGIARALSSINPDEHTDEVWGSPQYFSPEQAAGLAPSPASDVYSLGVVLYEMLTGQLPFTATDAQELARQHREARPVPPRRLNREIPPELEQILLKVLSKEPAQRYRSADQFGRLLMPFGTRNDYTPQTPVEIRSVPPQVYQQPAQAQVNSRPSAQPAPAYNPGQAYAASQPANQVPVSPNPGPAVPQASPLFTPDIIILTIISIVMWVGILPFGAYVLLKLGLLGTP